MLRWSDWLAQAERDLGGAKALRASGHFETCCFLCQQAAEKALKALLDYHGATRFGHELPPLLEEVGEFEDPPEEVHRACQRLNAHYIRARYPDAHQTGAPADHYGPEDAETALEEARVVLDFARHRLAPPA